MNETTFDDSQLFRVENIWKSDEMLKHMEANWKTFLKWCEQLGDRKSAVIAMVESMEERAIMAPASGRLEYHNCFPGGLIDHTLRVLKSTVELASSFKAKVSKEALIMASLFHDWGKIGTDKHDYYIRQESDWHRKRGQMYITNSAIVMPHAQLSLFMLHQHGVKLSEDEYIAILTHDGQYVEENKRYSMKEPTLALLVSMADRWSVQFEKNRTSLLDDDSGQQ
jgi:hypothetical protein